MQLYNIPICLYTFLGSLLLIIKPGLERSFQYNMDLNIYSNIFLEIIYNFFFYEMYFIY